MRLICWLLGHDWSTPRGVRYGAQVMLNPLGVARYFWVYCRRCHKERWFHLEKK